MVRSGSPEAVCPCLASQGQSCRESDAALCPRGTTCMCLRGLAGSYVAAPPFISARLAWDLRVCVRIHLERVENQRDVGAARPSPHVWGPEYGGGPFICSPGWFLRGLPFGLRRPLSAVLSGKCEEAQDLCGGAGTVNCAYRGVGLGSGFLLL